MKPNFIHLRLHSDYSIIEGLSKIDKIIEKTLTLNMPSIALTDFFNLFGAIKFYNKCHNYGIKPIIGVDCLINNNNQISNIILLVSNNDGYYNLKILLSYAYQKNYKNFIGPIINREWFVKYNKGLIMLSGALYGEIGKSLIQNDIKLAKKNINFYKKYFPNRFYLEIMRTNRLNEEYYISKIIDIAYSEKLPLVATNDICFINKKDFEIHNIRVAIYKNTLNTTKYFRFYTQEQYFKNEKEMLKLFLDIPEALQNTVEIAKRCNLRIELHKKFLPKFFTGHLSTKKFLIQKAKEGLQNRLKKNYLHPEKKLKYVTRLHDELKVINKMGFPGYFLIVMEFIQWAKKNKITVGPGRGSGAGSLVAYCLNITDIDPIKFNLLFERFLNPERISMPDFDIDFCMEKRDFVIDHVSQIYGKKSVSQIITFGTMAAKAAIRDVGRSLGYTYNFINNISKLIPNDVGITLTQACKLEPKLQEMYENNTDVKKLIDIAKKLEGIIKNIGKHAGGVVIAPTKITDFSPIYCDIHGNNSITQFDKDDIEKIGLVKFDFLGLKTLTIINYALKMIHQGKNKKIDINNIPLNDKKSFIFLKKAETKAIFQLESYGMKELIKRLQPDCFQDIVALIALFRPGPLQSGMVDNFINRKHGREVIAYPDSKWQHKSLKPILKSTYGIILYQEQVMQIAKILAGYNLGKADILRRAMGKKNPIEMAKQRVYFEKNAKMKGINSTLAIKIFNLVEKFAGYGFNKSHSTAYALISYQTLWLKTHYPSEFMASVMSLDMDNSEKIALLIYECWRMKLKILPPDINIGLYNFHVNNNNEIVYGMGAIKGIGESVVDEIIKSRNKYGKFINLFDFCIKIDLKKINKKILEKLIFSGAFDNFKINRTILKNKINFTLKSAYQYIESKSSGQFDLFGNFKIQTFNIKNNYENIIPWTEKEKLNKEKEVLGLYLTNHPINDYLEEIKLYTRENINLKNLFLLKKNNIFIKIIGLVLSIQTIITKQGNKIYSISLEDHTAKIDIFLSTDTFIKYQHIICKNQILIITAKAYYNFFSQKFKIIAKKIMDIDFIRNKYIQKILIFVSKNTINTKNLNLLSNILKKSKKGHIILEFYDNKKILLNNFIAQKNISNIYIDDIILNNLKWLFKNKNIKFQLHDK